jgi:HEAT repeat protein
MARCLIRRLRFPVLAATLILQGCDNSQPLASDREEPASSAARAAAADYVPPRSEALSGRTVSTNKATNATGEQFEAEDMPPWLAELLRSPDPNVRIQALDAWARQPTVSLDPVTYALVDPNESVRARAQEVLEQELSRRR